MTTKSREELIKQLERMRIKMTAIYMAFGNPEKVSADMILKEDIEIFKSLNKGCNK